jgi:hypothetical protein
MIFLPSNARLHDPDSLALQRFQIHVAERSELLHMRPIAVGERVADLHVSITDDMLTMPLRKLRCGMLWGFRILYGES